MIPVAITGIGVVSGFGLGVGPFWAGLVAGQSGLHALERYAALGAPLVGFVPGVEVRAFAKTPAARRMDRTSLLALAACRLAVVDAGAEPLPIPPGELGMVLSSSLGNLAETAQFLDRLNARGTGNPLVFPNLVMNAALSYASIELGVTGPTVLVTEREASGEAAIQWGVQQVASGRVPMCVAGGADELDPVIVEILRDARALAGGAPRPFDRHPSGVAPGEGAAVLMLEPLDRARARGARVYGVVRPDPGISVPAPVHGWPDPTALGQRLAPMMAGIDLVVAGAAGAREDHVEAEALVAAGGHPLVTAPRGAIGSFGAAGALGVAAAALAVHHGTVPPTLGCETPCLPALAVVRERSITRPLTAALAIGLARGGVCRPVRVDAVPA